MIKFVFISIYDLDETEKLTFLVDEDKLSNW